MVTPEENPSGEQPARPEQKPEQPRLDSDFFRKLVRQPECLTKGTCNGCGRCEH